MKHFKTTRFSVISLVAVMVLSTLLALPNVTPAATSPITLSVSVNPSTGVQKTTIFAFNASATSTAGTITRYYWNFGDGSDLAKYADPLHIYNSEGTFIAKCTAEDDAGNKTSMSIVITVLRK